jgi:hypothetical protein
MYDEALNIPTLYKCKRHFFKRKEAILFLNQCLIDGNEIEGISPSDKIPGWIVIYYETTPKKKVITMTVSELITTTNIGSFSLVFNNLLNQIIENPNPNIIGELKVKSANIDWLEQKAIITVVSI